MKLTFSPLNSTESPSYILFLLKCMCGIFNACCFVYTVFSNICRYNWCFWYKMIWLKMTEKWRMAYFNMYTLRKPIASSLDDIHRLPQANLSIPSTLLNQPLSIDRFVRFLCSQNLKLSVKRVKCSHYQYALQPILQQLYVFVK